MPHPSPLRGAFAVGLLAALAGATGCGSGDTSTFVLPATTTVTTTTSRGATPADATPTVEDASTSAPAAPAPPPTGTAASASASASGSPSPSLASGAAAKKIVSAAMDSLDRHGPYRVTVTLALKGRPSTTLVVGEFVPPSRDHIYLGSTKNPAIESITIGSQSWTREGKGPWQKDTSEPDSSNLDLPDDGDVVAVTEKASRDRTLRVFSVRLKDVPPSSRCSVTIDRSGRLRALMLDTPQGSTSFRYTYDRKIVIRPPR